MKNLIKDNLSLINSTISITVIKFIGSLAAFGITFIIGKYFGPEILGEYGFALSVIGIASLFARFGTDKNIVRQASLLLNKNKYDDLSNFLKSYLTILSLITIFFSLLIMFFGDSFVSLIKGTESNNNLYTLSLAIFSSSILIASAAITQADMRYKISTLFQFVLHPIMLLILIFWFFKNLQTANSFLYLYMISSFICAFLSVVYVYFRYIKIDKIIKKNKIFFSGGIRFYKESFSLFKAGAASHLLGLTDIILLGLFVDPKYIGIYVLAQRIANSLSMILTPINAYVAPKFARYSGDNDYTAIKDLTKKMIIFGSIITTTILISFLLVGKPILGIFGEDFLIGYYVLLILAFSQLVNALAGPLSQQIMMFDLNSQKVFSKISLIILSINLILHLFMIPAYGIEGAALTTLISSFLHNLLVYLYMKSRLGNQL